MFGLLSYKLKDTKLWFCPIPTELVTPSLPVWPFPPAAVLTRAVSSSGSFLLWYGPPLFKIQLQFPPLFFCSATSSSSLISVLHSSFSVKLTQQALLYLDHTTHTIRDDAWPSVLTPDIGHFTLQSRLAWRGEKLEQSSEVRAWAALGEGRLQRWHTINLLHVILTFRANFKLVVVQLCVELGNGALRAWHNC